MKKTLEEITGHESGAVQYEDGSIWIGNWSGIEGVPRQFVTGTLGYGEKLKAKRCAVPNEVKRAMQEHEKNQGTPVSEKGFRAWRVNDVVVVVVDGWH